jgi:DinB family protein
MKSDAAVGTRPEPDEYAPYYGRYISLVAGDDIIVTLGEQLRETSALLSSRAEADGDFRYAPEKWSVKEVIGHLSDSERIFAYRALRVSRNDQTPIEGFEQDDYVRHGGFGQRRLADVVDEFISVRRATLSLLRGLDEAVWTRRGLANKNEVSVRALAYIMAGHELHHRTILKDKYFSAIPR